MTPPPLLSIVIPTYGSLGVRLTESCLNAIWNSGLLSYLARDNPGRLLVPEIVVIDDGSPEDVHTQLLTLCQAQGVEQVLHTDQNTGHFSYLVNRAVELTSGLCVVVLNNDVEVRPGCLHILLSNIIYGGYGVVAPKLLYPNHTIQFGGMTYVTNPQAPSARGWFDHLFRFQDEWTLEANLACQELLTGACLAINRNLIDTIGMFDERFALSAEDVDYCLRANVAGFKCLYQPAAVAIHTEGATRGNSVVTKTNPVWNQREQSSLEFLYDKWSAYNFLQHQVI